MKEIRNLIDVLNLAGTKWVTQDYLAGVLKEPTTDLRSLTSSRDVQTGRASQQSVNIALFISAVGIIIGVIGLVSRFIK